MKSSPKKIFLIDGIGALASMIFLLGFTFIFNDFFGIPKSTLLSLSLLPFGFAIYSLSCYFLNPAKWQIFLKIIAFANLFYCFITFGLVIYYFNSITILGIMYFIIEKIIVIPLAVFELKLTKHH